MQRRSRSLIAIFSLPVAAALVFGVGAARRSAPTDSGLTLTADLTTRTLTVKKYDEVVGTFGVAIGSPNHPTPTGTFSVHKIVWNPAWIPPNTAWARNKRPTEPGDPDNPMRTVKIFFQEPDYYIHGTNNVASIGDAASHGCLRMDPDQAAQLALMIMDNGGVTRDWDWVKNILNLGESHTVNLSVASPMTITN